MKGLKNVQTDTNLLSEKIVKCNSKNYYYNFINARISDSCAIN